MLETVKQTMQDPSIQQYTQQVLEWLKSAKDVAMTEIPDILHQYLTWCAFNDGFWAVLSLIIASVCWYLACKFTKANDDEFLIVVPGVIGAASTVVFLVHIYDLMKLIIVPKIYILQAVGLIK